MLKRTTVTKIPTPTANWKELIKVFLFHVSILDAPGIKEIAFAQSHENKSLRRKI